MILAWASPFKLRLQKLTAPKCVLWHVQNMKFYIEIKKKITRRNIYLKTQFYYTMFSQFHFFPF